MPARIEINRLRQTERPTLLFCIIISALVITYLFIRPELHIYKYVILATLGVINIFVFVFQLFIVPSKLYTKTLADIESLLLSVSFVFIIPFLGGFESPFFFVLYLTLISSPINEVVPALMLGVIEILLLIIATIASPVMFAQFVEDPLRSIILIASPAVVTFFTITILYETITQKKEKEKAQQFSYLLSIEKAKLESVLASIQDVIIACDNHGVIVLANQALTDIFGIKEDTVLGKSFHDIFPSVDLSRREAQMIALTRQDKDTFEGKVDVRPLLGSRQLQLGMVIVFHSTKEETELERMKLDFVSMATHELRTPLTSIRGYLSLLRDDIGARLNPQEHKYIDRIAISSDTLATLIENILSLSNIERGSLKLSISSIDLRELLTETKQQFSFAASQKNITLKLIIEPINTFVKADRLRITEVLSNLVENALKFTQKDGIVTIRCRQETGDKLAVCIEDSGPGIPKVVQSHLFTKFYRASGTLQAGAKGTGLGLYISKSIIDLHNEKIWVESEEGSGAKFCFTVTTA